MCVQVYKLTFAGNLMCTKYSVHICYVFSLDQALANSIFVNHCDLDPVTADDPVTPDDPTGGMAFHKCILFCYLV